MIENTAPSMSFKNFLAPPGMLVELWGYPNPAGSFHGEPERAKLAAKPPFFASFAEKINDTF